MNAPQITHPEMEEVTEGNTETKFFLEPVYPSTEKLKARNLGGRQMAKLTYTLLQMLSEKDIPENLPASLLSQYHLVKRYNASCKYIFPATR